MNPEGMNGIGYGEGIIKYLEHLRCSSTPLRSCLEVDTILDSDPRYSQRFRLPSGSLQSVLMLLEYRHKGSLSRMVNHPFGVVVNFKTPDFPSPLRYLFGILFTLQVSSYRGLGNQGNQIISIAFQTIRYYLRVHSGKAFLNPVGYRMSG